MESVDDDDGDDDDRIDYDEQYQNGYSSIPYGFQYLAKYCHATKHCNIQFISHNTKTDEYIIIDSRGVSGWTNRLTGNKIRRLLQFEALKSNTLQSLLYSRCDNVYIALAKEHNLHVYNLNFHGIAIVECNESPISRLLYNIKTDEVISVSRYKLQFWKYSFHKQKHGLTLIKEFHVPESLLVRNAEFDNGLQRIYLLCDKDVWCYSVDGKCLFRLQSQSHSTYFSVCTYSTDANVIIVGAINGHICIYSPNGGLVTTLLNHSRIVTSVVVHPRDGQMFISSSMDGTIKLFSLQMLGELFSITVFSDGVYCMGIHSSNIIYCSSRKCLKLFELNYTFKFWSTIHCPVKKMNIIPKKHGLKSYVFVNTTDSSIRLYRKRTGQRRCTILPPPELSTSNDVLSIAFDRSGRVVYLLFAPMELWIYSTRTDPATRVATWNIEQSMKNSGNIIDLEEENDDNIHQSRNFGSSNAIQRQANENIGCTCLLTVRRNIYVVDVPLSLLKFEFLLCGLTNGTIVFLDPCNQGNVYRSFKAHSTSPILDIRVNYNNPFTHLLTLIRTFTQRLIRLWNAATLTCFYEVQIPHEICVFCYKNFHFVAGGKTGRVDIETVKNDVKTSLVPGYSSGQQNLNDHTGEIFSVDVLENSCSVLSCGSDHFVRVWDIHKVLLTEVRFDESLQSALFLNSDGTILISFKSHLFVIPHYVSFYGLSNRLLSSDSSGDESTIYEDPIVTREYKTDRPTLNITLSDYLVPYPNLGLEALWLFENTIANHESNQEIAASDERDSDCSIDSFASTTIYQDSVPSEMSILGEINFPRCDSTPISSGNEYESESVVFDDYEQPNSVEKVDDTNDNPKTNASNIVNKELTETKSISQLDIYHQLRSNIMPVNDIIVSSKSTASRSRIDIMKPLPLGTPPFRKIPTKAEVQKKKLRNHVKKSKIRAPNNANQYHSSRKYHRNDPKVPIQSEVLEQRLTQQQHHHHQQQQQQQQQQQRHSFSNSKECFVRVVRDKPNKQLSRNASNHLRSTPTIFKQLKSSKPAIVKSTTLSFPDDTHKSSFFAHHSSLLLPTMGKSQRNISSSYKNVLKSLTKNVSSHQTCQSKSNKSVLKSTKIPSVVLIDCDKTNNTLDLNKMNIENRLDDGASSQKVVSENTFESLDEKHYSMVSPQNNDAEINESRELAAIVLNVSHRTENQVERKEDGLLSVVRSTSDRHDTVGSSVSQVNMSRSVKERKDLTGESPGLQQPEKIIAHDDLNSNELSIIGKSSDVFKLFTDEPRQLVENNNGVMIKSTQLQPIVHHKSDQVLLDDAEALEEKQRYMINFILSAFKRPLDKRTKKTKVGGNEHVGCIQGRMSDFSNSLLTPSEDATPSCLITPKKSVSFSRDPINDVVIIRSDSKKNFDLENTDRRYIINSVDVMNSSNSSLLFHKLRKHKSNQEKRKSLETRLYEQRSNSARSCRSSGYETTLSRDEMSTKKGRSLMYTTTKWLNGTQKLACSEYACGVEQVEMKNTSESVYYGHPNSTKKLFRKSEKNTQEKKEKIKNLEMKLSGQPHRYHRIKTSEEMEKNRLTLCFLKTSKEKNFFQPVERSVSIPTRCQYELVSGNETSNNM